MGTFEEPKGGPLDIGEEYCEITILGGEEYWVTGENIHPWLARYLRIADIDLWEGGRTFANLTDVSNILEFRFPLC